MKLQLTTLSWVSHLIRLFPSTPTEKLTVFWELCKRWEKMWWCLSSCAIPAHLKSPVFQMNTVTSALISGVIILGVMSVCFFIFSLSLLKGKSAPVRSVSGVHNPAFSWAPDHNLPHVHAQLTVLGGDRYTFSLLKGDEVVNRSFKGL